MVHFAVQLIAFYILIYVLSHVDFKNKTRCTFFIISYVMLYLAFLGYFGESMTAFSDSLVNPAVNNESGASVYDLVDD